MNFKNILAIAGLLIATNVFAHEGHDLLPGNLKANHGGTVKAGKEINLEYVVAGSEVSLYPISHEGVDLSANDVKITATEKSPKGKKVDSKLEVKNGAYVANVDFKGAYRVEMNVTANNKGKVSTFKFQVEK